MVGEGGWPVYEPGANSLADLYPYVEFEIDTAAEVDVGEFGGDEETTEVMPSAWLVERCATSAALGAAK